MKTRYAVVTHPIKDATLKLVDNKILGKQPTHHLLGRYDWFRLNEDHIMMRAQCSLQTFEAFNSHPTTSVLPPVISPNTIHSHFKKKLLITPHLNPHSHSHLNSLIEHLDLDEDTRMIDLMEQIEAKYGHFYTP